MNDGFEDYDRWKSTPPDDNDPAYRQPLTLYICPKGHRRLVRDPRRPGPCWSCRAKTKDMNDEPLD
jgi:hypothetical protein